MSLLMQALKKAERAKQNSLADDEQDKPSEAFDEILALTPEPARPASAPAPAPAARSFSLEGLSLEPMAGDAPGGAAPAASVARPSPSPLPAASDHKDAGLTLDLVPDPSAPASPAAAAPASAPAPAAGQPSNYATRSAEAAAASAPAAATAAAETAAAAGAAANAAAASAAAASAATTRASAAGKAAASGAGSGAEKPRAAARARARAAATTEPTGMDPERLRLIGLIALVVILVGGFGLYYWRALTAPGAGADLPPVPMPPPGATGATPAQAIVSVIAPGGSAGGTAGDPSANADAALDDPMLSTGGGNRAAQQALERRIAKTEEDLAAARQAIQVATAAATAPRVEQMPPLAAAESGEIRVARSTQPSAVSPALDGAYSAFNGGDLPGAQQQYDNALSQDPNNRDALLGAAAVAARQNQKDKAAAYYLRLLDLSPNDGAATAGLIGLRQGDTSQSEARLKAILAGNPEAAPVLFALGNLYSQQGRWSDAQQAYFRATGAAPDNPDYAYNLAVGLDRLNQPKLALTYYQRALALAQDKAVGFDRNALRKRMHELSSGNVTH
ncbi:tetratricopeptide repeat protein [Duganella sp. BuS-21]|uniref:tetratricopeptide repeat protein n=1 Tax=Duganella sp. BuS-21 TaxID=2943848 RepID=UPI0035A70F06